LEQWHQLLDNEEGANMLMMQTPRAVRGFTLIELLITFTLLGILVALSLPTFSGWIRNSQVRSVAEALQNGLRTAQTEALRRNQAVVISFTNDANPKKDPATVEGGKNWSIQTIISPLVYEPGNAAVAEFIKAGVFSDVASGVEIKVPAGGAGAVCFNANGRVSANAKPTDSASAANTCTAGQQIFTIQQTAADRPLKVYVEVGGKVRMCDPKRTLSATVPDGCP
jgi:type IV fimbrial biogenesis protein FimT